MAKWYTAPFTNAFWGEIESVDFSHGESAGPYRQFADGLRAAAIAGSSGLAGVRGSIVVCDSPVSSGASGVGFGDEGFAVWIFCDRGVVAVFDLATQ